MRGRFCRLDRYCPYLFRIRSAGEGGARVDERCKRYKSAGQDEKGERETSQGGHRFQGVLTTLSFYRIARILASTA